MAEVWVRHWTVADEGFTDRWELETDDGRLGWVDRVADGDRVLYDYRVEGREGRCPTRGAAMSMVEEALGVDRWPRCGW